MKSRFVVVMALAAMLLCSSVSFGATTYSDVETALETISPGAMPEIISFKFETVFHQDRFVTGRTDGLAVNNLTPGGYITVEGPTMISPVVSYGMGTFDSVWVTAGGINRKITEINTSLNGAFGNLVIDKETLVSSGDTQTALPGGGLGVDVMTGQFGIPVDAVQYTDANGDGVIEFRTDYKFGVPGDSNRDGVENWDPLTEAPGGPMGYGVSDRPFLAIYENTSGTSIDLTNPPVDTATPPNPIDYDGDGMSVDNMWVGNPYVSVEAIGPGGVYNDVVDADPAIQNIDGFGAPLVVGEIVSLSLLNSIKLNPDVNSDSFFVSAEMNVKVVGGRLLEYANDLDAVIEYLAGQLNGSAFFRPGDPDADVFNKYVWGPDNGSFDVTIPDAPPIAEPGSLSLLLGGVALAFRRRRK
jgi:hypothetical protein